MSDIEKYSNDLLNDDSFIVWVASNFKTDNQHWSHIKSNLSLQEAKKFKNAVQILLKLNTLNSDDSQPRKSQEFVDQQFNRLLEASEKTENKDVKVFKLSAFFKYAAAIVILISISSVVLLSNNSIYKFEDNLTETVYNSTDILILTPENKYFKISEDSQKEWSISNGISVKVTGEKISFTSVSGKPSEDINKFKIIVPLNKHFKLNLIDGTEIELHSNTTITFNNSTVSKKRKVDLVGEAIFNVAHDKARPFIVQSSDMKIEALGTIFNVSNYSENNYTSTTLIDGSIKVSNPQGENETIKPGYEVKFFHNQNRLIINNVKEKKKISSNFFQKNNKSILTIKNKEPLKAPTTI